MSYHHTQRGSIHHLLYPIAIVMAASVFFLPPLLSLRILFWVVAGVFVALGSAFAQLTVSDEGDCLAIRFGPLPLFGKRIRFDEIASVESGRTALIDGWGIHYMPARGWTYNIAGRDCVEMAVKGRTVRVGTDDVEGLMEFLRGRVGVMP